MAGMTQKEQVKTALIRLDDSITLLGEVIATGHQGLFRPFPFPETRSDLDSLRRLRRNLSDNWEYLWSQQS